MNYNDIVIYLVKRLLTAKEDGWVTLIRKDQTRVEGLLFGLNLSALDEASSVALHRGISVTEGETIEILLFDIAYIEIVDESEVV